MTHIIQGNRIDAALPLQVRDALSLAQLQALVAAAATEGTLAAVEALLGGGLPANLDGGKLAVKADQGTDAYAVHGHGALVGVDFTRPADTTAYAAKDVVGPAVTANLTFANVARVNGGSGIITKARVVTSQSANVASYRLYLYHTAPVAIADNSPFPLLLANRANRVGFIDIGPMATEGAGSDCAAAQNNWDRMTFKCAAGSRTLYGILVTQTVFTPANAQTYYVELTSIGVD